MTQYEELPVGIAEVHPFTFTDADRSQIAEYPPIDGDYKREGYGMTHTPQHTDQIPEICYEMARRSIESGDPDKYLEVFKILLGMRMEAGKI